MENSPLGARSKWHRSWFINVAHLSVGQVGRRATAPMQLLDPRLIAEQLSLQTDLALEIIQVGGSLRGLSGDDLVARAVEANRVAERNVNVEGKRTAHRPEISLAGPSAVGIGAKRLDEAVRGRIRCVPGPVAIEPADQIEIDFERFRCASGGFCGRCHRAGDWLERDPSCQHDGATLLICVN